MEGLIKTVVVLGGGISEEGILPIWVRSRLEKAIQLYSGTCNTQLIVCGKGRDNFPVSESKAMADYLIKSAVPTDAILQESLSTRSEEHTSELQSRRNLVCRLLLEKKNT